MAAASGADERAQRLRAVRRPRRGVGRPAPRLATTARAARDASSRVLTAREAAAALRAARWRRGDAVGILFGPERTGLTNDELRWPTPSSPIPVNPAFASLNLAQAVLLFGYEWWQRPRTPRPRRPWSSTAPSPPPRPSWRASSRGSRRRSTSAGSCATGHAADMVRNIRAISARAGLMAHEIRTLQGILTGLTERPHASPVPGGGGGRRHRAKHLHLALAAAQAEAPRRLDWEICPAAATRWHR